MTFGFLLNKYRVLSLTLLLVGVFFLSSVAHAINIEETFVFENVVEPSAVEFTGVMTGQPRYNSGVNYFHSFFGNLDFVDPAYQLRIVASVDTPAEIPFKLEGFAWNNPWGWISFKCQGGLNRGQPCNGIYETQIEMPFYSPLLPTGTITGQAWNPNIGEINFSWTCPLGDMLCNITEMSPFSSKRVKLNFNTGLIYGYAWNDRVGWMYFQGYMNPIPELKGFTCGDGQTQPGEQCDDGNLVNDDACTNACISSVCGDGIASAAIGEQCDDSNVISGDGCSDTCQLEFPAPSFCGDGFVNPGEVCDEGFAYDRPLDGNNDGECIIDNTSPSVSCTLNTCGDGYFWAVGLGGNEECDDGNIANGDGCNKFCLLELPTQICGDGFVNGSESCDLGSDAYGNSLNKINSSCPNCVDFACGDGYRFPAKEQCDDGNTVSGDGCSGTGGAPATWCKLEIGTHPVCGDGVENGTDQCDDGNLVDGDGCSSTCNLETAICGDGFFNAYTEQCDDGNLYSGDGCDALCNDEVPGAVCGNSIIEPNSIYGGNEECDDGNILSYDGCNSKCKIEASWCRDGITNGIEQCDDGNNIDNDVCKNDCTFGAYSICGDSNVTFGEACDDGNNQNGDGCSSVCKLDSDAPTDPFISINDCEDVVSYIAQMFNIQLDSNIICNEYCGNGYLEDGEECEDGNILSGDGCSATCIDEAAGAVCGNYIQEIGEGCDDGNNNSGDGCSSSCTDEDQIIYLDDPTCEEVFGIFEDILNIDIYAAGFCNTNPAYCGNGTWDEGQEECDPTDINDLPYSLYCTSFCEFEPVGWCGDGVHDPGEECDDGNFQNGDGCDEWCEYEFEPGTCGDGLWSLGEECEPGVSASIPLNPPGLTCGAAASDSPCELLTSGFCGDFITQHGEACDPTDATNPPPLGSVCTTSCELEFVPPQLTCFPYTDIQKTWHPTKGDVYTVGVKLNCLEEPSSVSPWNISLTGFDAINTVDCDQINGSDPTCVQEVPIVVPPLTALGNGMIQIGEVYSYAPTGYTSVGDSDNSYTLTSVDVLVTNGFGSPIYQETVPTDNYSMDFTPLISSQTLNATYGIGPSREENVPYLDLEYDESVSFFSRLKNNLSTTITGVSANYTLSLGPNSPYEFKFDRNKNSNWTDAVDTPNLIRHPNGNKINASSTWDGLSSTPTQYAYYEGRVVGTGPQGEPEGESMSMVINYTRGGHTVSYPADSIPKAADFLLDGYGVQITGPVNTDKILGSTSFMEVGSVGEAVKRRNITSNVSRIVKSSDIAASIATSFSFDPFNLYGGDYLSYVVSTGGVSETDQHIFYFKDDVVLSGGLNNDQNRAIITEGGDVYINGDIFNLPLDGDPNNEDSRLEIVALKDKNGRGGNVFIGPNVVYLSANIVADGSLLAYDGNSRNGSVPDFEVLESSGLLDHQLTFEGSLTSNNTIGGSEGSTFYKGDGSVTLDQNEARIYDLNFFRRHGLIPGATDSAGNPQDCNGTPGLQIQNSYFTANTCLSGGSNPSDLIPAGNRWLGRAANENYGMYFNYRPPAKNSAIFGKADSVSASGN